MSSSLQDSVNAWCDRQRGLLRAEEKASELRSAQKKGLVGDVEGLETGTGGNVLVTVRFETKQFSAVAESYRAGDAVSISSVVVVDGIVCRGVVASTGAHFMIVSVDDAKWPPEWGSAMTLRLTSSSNPVVFTRIHGALRKVSEGVAVETMPELVSLVFGEGGVSSSHPPPPPPPIQFMSPSLNPSQQTAVTHAACPAQALHLIHGPPGTGKTTTLCELLRQLIIVQNLRVLVCAPSNTAVDNILDKLMNTPEDTKKGIRALRIGDVARVSASVSRFSLDEMLMASEGYAIAKDVRKDIDKAMKGRTRWSEVRALRCELRERETTALTQLLQSSNLVACTVNGSAHHSLKTCSTPFDVVVVDEAAQALHAECWIPLLRAKKWVLAGDPFQLPPTVLSASPELSLSLLELLLQKYSHSHETICTLLDTQYRMHDDISRWSSREFYGGRLRSSPCVAAALLCDVVGISDTAETSCPLVFTDTCALGYEESFVNPYDNSRVNVGEAGLVAEAVTRLVGAGVRPCDIGVITPYAAQSVLIKSLLTTFGGEGLEVSTVDSFQGREKIAVVLSMVRCNTEGEVGFLSESRRVNVAVTRAMRHLCVIGDSTTMRQDPFLKRFCEYLDENAC